MATLDDYPISPEAVSTVLGVWRLHSKTTALGLPWGDFTIRIAKWVARLSRVTVDEKGMAGLSGVTEFGRIYALARLYAETEKLYQSINRPFDSTDLDHVLMGMPIDAAGEQLASVFTAELAKVVAAEKAITKSLAKYELREHDRSHTQEGQE